MQIVQLSGGLGNQLFQYAYYLKLKKMGLETYLDDISCYKTERDRNNQLICVGAEYDKASLKDILNLTDRDKHIISWVRRRISGSRDVVCREGSAISEDGYWIGYWQSGEGYDLISNELRSNIFGSNFEDEIIDSDIKRRIEGDLSVSIHIRRGDYLNSDVVSVYGGICTDEYYKTAIDYMRKEHPGCTFYIFSNDSEWVKEKYTSSDMVVMEGNDESHGYRDMYLMSKCKHNIMANSSFSWWGSWLNTNPNKSIIGPTVWIHREGFDGIYKGLDVLTISPEGKIN